jgi:transcriptional regulator with XRE-family HTH domain
VTPAERHLRNALAHAIHEGRTALGWSRRELSRRSGVSRATIALLELAAVNSTLEMAGRVLAPMGVVLDLRHRLPFVEPLQRDAAHALCVAYVQRRLERDGWIVLREVEVEDGPARGWIDLLAWHPGRHLLLVIEVKTEIRDLGAIERTVQWYRRGAVSAARARGWQPRIVGVWLVLLWTEANEAALAMNRDALAQSFPRRAPELLDDPGDPRPGLALIDPSSRRRAWLVRSRIDGRRTPAPYADYRSFMADRSIPLATSRTAVRGQGP